MGIPRGLNFPFGLGIMTLLVIPTLYCPEITCSLIHSNFVIVVPSIVIWSNYDVFDPLDCDSFMYAAFHKSISSRSLKSLSFVNFGS